MVQRFDETPLPVDIADHAFANLLRIVSVVERGFAAPAAEQLAMLNRVAG